MNLLRQIGFRYAPVTKFLVPIVGGCSALAAVYNVNNTPINMAIQLSHLSSDCQVSLFFLTANLYNEQDKLTRHRYDSSGDYLVHIALLVVLEQQL